MYENIFTIDERELSVLEVIEKNNNITQRELSKKTGLSLGLTNIILKRLAKKGYIKIKRMNKKKILYHLTPQAIFDKTNRTYKYLVSSVNIVLNIRENLYKYLNDNKIVEKYNKFIIIGHNEISEIVRLIFKDIGLKNSILKEDEKKEFKDDIFYINCEMERVNDIDNILNIVDILNLNLEK